MSEDGLVRHVADAGNAVVRAELLDGIRSRRREFGEAGERAERLRALPEDTVRTLREMGVFWLKTPDEFGGTLLTPLEFCDVMEEIGYADTVTAWVTMVGNGGTGTAAGWLPDAGARRVFVAGQPPPLIVGVPRAAGKGRPVTDGYLVSGRWSFASGIAHADWLIAGFQEAGDGGRAMVGVVPKADVEVIDTWHVAGLQGTGSPDFRMDEVFIPVELTFERAGAATRREALFRQEEHVFLSNEIPPLCIGMARRALDEMTGLAGRTARFPGGSALGERAVFHSELGRAETKVRAARLVHRDAVAAAWAEALAGTGGSDSVHAAVTAASIFAAETCAEVITDLFRYGGGRALALSSPMQRYLRDALATRQHIGVSEQFYETAGLRRIQAWDSRGLRVRFPRPKGARGGYVAVHSRTPPALTCLGTQQQEFCYHNMGRRQHRAR